MPSTFVDHRIPAMWKVGFNVGVDDVIGNSEDYEVPTLVEVGTVRGLTRGHLFAPGQDHLSFVPIPGLFGSH